MTVKNTIRGIENGSKHIILIDAETGEIYLSTIWHSDIPDDFINRNVADMVEKTYELRLFV